MPLLRKKGRISLLILVTAMIVVVVLGVIFASYRSREVDRKIREDILIQTVEIARTINPDQVKKLTYTGSDYKLPEYRQIRSQMSAYGKLIRQRGIYSMALKGSNLVFGPENYPEGDSMGSGPPGTIYEQPSEADFRIFKDGKPVVTGPITDEYGTFISGMAPVFDPHTGKVLMVIGIDILAEDIQRSITRAQMMPVVGTVLVLLLLGSGSFLIGYRNRLPEKSKLKFRHIETFLTATVGILLTIAAVLALKESDTHENNYLFRIKSNSEIDAVRNEFLKVNQELLTLETFFLNSNFVDPEEFINFTTSSGFSKISARFFWAPKINLNRRSQFEKDIRDLSGKPVSIKEFRSAGEIIPAGARAVYYPVLYADTSFLPALSSGFDMNSIPVIASAIEQAQRTRMTTGVEYNTSYRNNFTHSTILALDPVFRTPSSSSSSHFNTVYQTDSGFIGALVNIPAIINNSLKSNSVLGPQLDIDLVDLTVEPKPVRIGSPDDAHNNREKEFSLDEYKKLGFYYMAPLFVFGKSYAIITHSTEINQKAAPVSLTWMVIIVGLFITGITTFFVKFIQDKHVILASQVKQRTSELEAAMGKALESDRLKSAFLANMSHEIRTPMNAIVGFSSLLGEPDLQKEERDKYIDIIKSRSDDLLHLVNDIIEMSRIESGTAQLVKSEVDLNEIMDELSVVFNQKRLKLKKTDVRLVTEKPEYDKSKIISDGYIIRQILSNLLDNALKFTHQGEISFGYLTDDHSRVTCFVRDSGIGISAPDKKVIFDSFRQGEIKDIHSYGGTGLGLSICKGSVALLGGTIHVESVLGTGSRIYFTFPAEFVKTETIPQKESSAIQHETINYHWKGRKILVVEDEPTNLDYLLTVLLPTGADLLSATCGKEVRDLYDSIDTVNLVLLDIRLPDIDGMELSRELKSNFPTLIVVAQTAFAMPGDHKKGIEHGFDDYLTKPTERRVLLRKLDAFLNPGNRII